MTEFHVENYNTLFLGPAKRWAKFNANFNHCGEGLFQGKGRNHEPLSSNTLFVSMLIWMQKNNDTRHWVNWVEYLRLHLNLKMFWELRIAIRNFMVVRR